MEKFDINIKNQAEVTFNKNKLKTVLETPDNTTVTAIEEGKKLMQDPSTPSYSSMDELKKALAE